MLFRGIVSVSLVAVTIQAAAVADAGSGMIAGVVVHVPGDTLGTADIGAITSARPARTIQLGARVSF